VNLVISTDFSSTGRASVDVDGRRIAFYTWGYAKDPPVYLVHGSSATARWWRDIAASLVEMGHFVVAVELSGHGDSSHHSTYGYVQWAREVHAVIHATGGRGDAVLVGHSMGGSVCMRAAMDFGTELAGVVVVDSVVREPTNEDWLVRRARSGRPHTVYPTRDAAISRFRTIPETTSADALLLRHIAESSITPVQGGWTWKFDMGIFGKDSLQPPQLERPDCPVRLVRGDRGLVDETMAATIAHRLGCPPAVVIENCGHQVMLDRPTELLRLLQIWLDEWQRTELN
jgi:pimeloyl-ACP methyl ester carboxylesterase